MTIIFINQIGITSSKRFFNEMQYNHNRYNADTDSLVFFVDMNSYFAACEQQVNYYLRGRPVGVCVYTGKYGCIIAPSIEAKRQGVKTGMRLNDAIKVCPDLVPIETHPARYRAFHVQIINVLKKYCDEVIPRSIDEAVMDLTSYKKIYPNPLELALRIKEDIKREVGDWFTCSIGIAPNAFLAKLATDLQKPDGLVTIMPDNIEQVLSKLQLTDLPGISKGMAARLERGNIYTPLELRNASPDYLKRICKSIVGVHWHYRLNFAEVDLMTRDYKSMQAMRQISKEQRENVETLREMLLTLCMTLERRMVHNNVFAKDFFMSIKYEDGFRWDDKVIHQRPLQDGVELYEVVKSKMKKFQETHQCEPLINTNILSMCVGVTDFISDELIQYNLFENNVKKDKLRKIVYGIKDKHGSNKIMKAAELRDHDIMKDVIGFGSVKDLE